ncbi:MAG: BamA/TamA family outer membrane protein [Bacteroidia bacterium]|nr:BamA/TamA family outer membrane protein [Bacteroidia bacterium]
MTLLCLSFAFIACNPTKHLAPGQLLIQNTPKVKSEKKLPESVLNEAVKTEANRRMLYPRTYLHLYNLGLSLHKDSSWLKRGMLKSSRITKSYNNTVNWLVKEIGEPPALLDQAHIDADIVSLRELCFANGYFYPSVYAELDTLKGIFDRGQVAIKYQVKEGTAYKIRKLNYILPPSADSSIFKYIDAENSLLKPEENYRQISFAGEMARLTNNLRDNGYFSFSQNLISFEVDSLNIRENELDSVGQVLENKYLDISVIFERIPSRYQIREINLNIKSLNNGVSVNAEDFVDMRGEFLTEAFREKWKIDQDILHDTIPLNFNIDKEHIHVINYNFLARRIHLKEEAPFSQTEARKTQKRLGELGMFQYAIINYELIDSIQALDVNIDLQLATRYQMKFGVESFSQNIFTSNIPGIGGNFTIRNRNTFHKSEFLDWSVQARIGWYASEEGASQFQRVFYEVGTELNLNFPRFLLPFGNKKRDLSLLSPISTMSSSLKRVDRREFARTQAGFQLTYRWNHKPFQDRAVSRLRPIVLEVIDIDTQDEFQKLVVDELAPAIRRDFENRISSRLEYSFTYQNYQSTRLFPTFWTQFNVQWGGNLPFFLDGLTSLAISDTSTRDNLLFGKLFYGQFGKASIETKFTIPVTRQSDLVLRGFIGGALPYNETSTVPRESRFFSGGTNSMRGWRSNTLGPGTTSLKEILDLDSEDQLQGISLIAPGGEWIFELNAEYRFKAGGILELALFTDAGNVWFHRPKNGEPPLGEKSLLTKENLKLGWDAGIGFRFDFSFLILRMDIAQQLYAPDLDNGWILGNSNSRDRRPQLNLGINYPF